MEQDYYVISQHGTEWLLRWNGRDLSTFDDKERAIHAARVAARLSHQRGRAVTVIADGREDAAGLTG